MGCPLLYTARCSGGVPQSAAQLRPAVPCARLRPLLDEQLLEGQLLRVDHLLGLGLGIGIGSGLGLGLGLGLGFGLGLGLAG